MESSRPKKETNTKGHITPGNGNRHEKNEQELDGTRKEGPGQSGFENTGRQPMLHWGSNRRAITMNGKMNLGNFSMFTSNDFHIESEVLEQGFNESR
ncbi:unnamed protein product [Schistosoma margrebowiei]|uniref:Uncharacterized protein n=1 Tax=Schistosoma margrebowiei TaxID=48269 RepID=A0A183LXK1_9TREM|nr:unnamed protein product [Schistosoma margrebowiei]